MIGCLFALVVLAVLGLAVLLIPVGTALSMGQAAVVTALLGAAAWTARAAFREGGALALVVVLPDDERCFPALPEDETGTVAVRLRAGEDGLELLPSSAPGPAAPASESAPGPDEQRPKDQPPAEFAPLLTFARTRAGARRGRLRLSLGGEVLWEVRDARLGRRHSVPSEVLPRLDRLGAAAPLAVVFLDR